MISRIIILLLISVQSSYSIKLNKHDTNHSKIQIVFEVDEDLIGFSNYFKYSYEDYFFIDSIYDNIEIFRPKNFEIRDSILEINFMGKDTEYSYYEGETEIIVGGCCEMYKGSLIYIEIDSISEPIIYIKVGFNKYSGFLINK